MVKVIDSHYLILALLFIAAGWDYRHGRIPNALILFGLIAGLVTRIFEDGAGGAAVFLFRASWPLLLMYILFYARMLGAGDIKLFCVLSPFLSTTDEIRVIILSFILGAGFSCYRIIRRREMLKRISVFGIYIRECLSRKKVLKYSTLDNSNSFVRFSVFILAAYVLLPLGGFVW